MEIYLAMPLMLTCLGGTRDLALLIGRAGLVILNISTDDSAVTGLVAEQAGRSGRRHGEPDLQQLAKLRPRRG